MFTSTFGQVYCRVRKMLFVQKKLCLGRNWHINTLPELIELWELLTEERQSAFALEVFLQYKEVRAKHPWMYYGYRARPRTRIANLAG